MIFYCFQCRKWKITFCNLIPDSIDQRTANGNIWLFRAIRHKPDCPQERGPLKQSLNWFRQQNREQGEMKELFEKNFRSAEILNNLFCGKSNLFCRKLIFPCNFSDEKTEKKAGETMTIRTIQKKNTSFRITHFLRKSMHRWRWIKRSNRTTKENIDEKDPKKVRKWKIV